MVRVRWNSIVASALGIGLAALLAVLVGCRPEPDGVEGEPARVLDSADILLPGQHRSISDYLRYIETERGIDYRVVVVDNPSLDLEVESVASYERLGVGDATEGRGLLLLVNVGADEARVEVGYSLEHRVRDVEASSMIREETASRCTEGA